MKPTLFGYGLTTKAIAKSLGGGCTFFDDNTKEAYYDEQNNHILPSNLFDPNKSDLEVTTPSLPPHHQLIQKAKNLHSEYDYFASSMPFSIWISGTNGKTTTTQMLTHLLQNKGAVSGGNIGTPLANLSKEANIWVLESSSYTLHHTNIASPNIYLLLPITPDHLEWHKTKENYEQDKLRPLLAMKEGELALVPKGLNLPKSAAYIVEYDSNEFLEEYFSLDSSKLNFKGAFLQDALLAMSIVKALYDETNYELMNSFKVDAHRQEEFTDSQNRLWVNDSKATNIDATIQALKSYKNQHIHLIVGGDDKGVNLSPLFDSFKDYLLTLYIIGENPKQFLELAKNKNISHHFTKNLKNTVNAIDKVHNKNSVALLSPAAASFDQFNSYKHRGDEFKKLVKSLN